MTTMRFFFFLLLLPIILSLDFHPEVIKDAEFAVRELQALSDSGIYHTLQLHSILHAQQSPGIYHDNLALRLELSCPHYKSRLPTESFNMIVMKHRTDNITTLAIDEFPVMDEDAIELFYIQRVENHRVDREKAFDRLYRDAMKADIQLPQQQAHAEVKVAVEPSSGQQTVDEDEAVDEGMLRRMSLKELHGLLTDKATSAAQRRKVQQVIRQQHR